MHQKARQRSKKLCVGRVITGDCHLCPQAWAHPYEWIASVVERLSCVPAFPGLAGEQLGALEPAACDLCPQIAIPWGRGTV